MKLKKPFLIATITLLSSALIHAMTTEQRRVKLARFNEMVNENAIEKNNAERQKWLAEFEQVKNALVTFLGIGQIQLADVKIKEFKAEAGTAMAKFKELQEDFTNLEKASVKPAFETFENLVEKLKTDGTEWDPFIADPATASIPFSYYVDQAITLTQDQTAFLDQHPTMKPEKKDDGKKLLASFKNFVLARAVLYSLQLITTAADKIEEIELAKDGALALNKFEDMYETLDEILELLRRARYESGIFDVDGNLITPDEDNVTVFNEENAFNNDIFNFKDMGQTLIDSIKTDIWQPLIDKIYQLQLVVTEADSAAQIADVGDKTKEQLYGAVNADEIRAIDLDIAYQVGPAFLDRLDILRTLFNIPDNRQMPQPTAVGGNAQAKVTIQNFESEFNKRATAVGAPVAPVNVKAFEKLQKDFKNLESSSVVSLIKTIKTLVDQKLKIGGTEWGPFMADPAATSIPFSSYVDQGIILTKNYTLFLDKHPTITPESKNRAKNKMIKVKNFVLARAMQYVRYLLEAANDKIEAIKLDENEALKTDRKTNLYKAFDDVLELLQRARYESGIYKADGTFLDEIPDVDDSYVYNDENKFGTNTFDFATQKKVIANDILKTAVWQTFVNKIYQLQLVVTKDDSAAQIADVGGKTKKQLYGTADADEIRAIDLDIAYQVGPALVDRLNIMRSMFNITDDKQMPKPTDGEEQAGTIVENFTTAFNNRATAVSAPVAPPVDVKAEVDKVADIYKKLGEFEAYTIHVKHYLGQNNQGDTEWSLDAAQFALQQAKDYYLAEAAAMDAQVANDLKTAINKAIGNAETDDTYKKFYAGVGAKGWDRPADIDPIP